MNNDLSRDFHLKILDGCVNYSDYNPLLTFFRKIYTSWDRKESGYECERKFIFLSALNELMRFEKSKKEEESFTEEIVRVIDYINMNHNETMTREQLSSIIGLSGSYFAIMFKNCTYKLYK